MAGGVSILFSCYSSTFESGVERELIFLLHRYGEDKELTEDYAKDIWEFGY